MLENEPSSCSFCFPENAFSGVGVSFFLSTAITCKAFKITKNVSVDILCPFKLPCVLVSFPLAFYLPGEGRVALL